MFIYLFLEDYLVLSIEYYVYLLAIKLSSYVTATVWHTFAASKLDKAASRKWGELYISVRQSSKVFKGLRVSTNMLQFIDVFTALLLASFGQGESSKSKKPFT